MKKALTIVALAVTALLAQAQDSSSSSSSGSNSGSTSTASQNTNNSVNASGSTSGSTSGASSGSTGNQVILNQNTPAEQRVTSTSNNTSRSTSRNVNVNRSTSNSVNRNINEGTSTSNQVLSGGTNSTNRNINEGTATQRLEGGTTNTNRNINEGTSTQNLNQSGDTTQRVISSGGVENYNEVGGGTNNTNFSQENIHYSGTQTVKSAPAIAMSGPASGPCTGQSGGVAVSGLGWGVGANGSTVMDDCRLRENTRVIGMGMQSIDGNTHPAEKGEAMVMFMDAMRGLAQYNNTIYSRTNSDSK
jgi:hypothetical protein